MTSPAIDPRDLRFRRPTEADYAAVASVVDDWWDGRVVQGLLPRLWFRHFTDTSWVAELEAVPDSRRIVGFLVGFVSPGPQVGVIQAVGVDQRHRRSGIGRALVERFIEDARSAGIATVETVFWPGNRRALAFLAALGFGPEPAPDTREIYGVPAYEGYDFGTDDRAVFSRGV